MTGQQRADSLASSRPEVSWQRGRLRIFLPAARLYGGRHGGAVVLLDRDDAEQVCRTLRELLDQPKAVGR